MAFGASLASLFPVDHSKAASQAESVIEPGCVYAWRCPDAGGIISSCAFVGLDITEDEFEGSMSDRILRKGILTSPAPVSFVDPTDRHVAQVAEQICSETSGYGDRARALAALWFVQTAIQYASDADLYGEDEFWARPLETLYCHKGDCEDTSVLLCSILLAMGFDAVLLDYPGHVAVGVCLEGAEGTYYPYGGKSYFLCETARDDTCPIGQGCRALDTPDIYRPGGKGSPPEALVSGLRLLVWGIFGFRV